MITFDTDERGYLRARALTTSSRIMRSSLNRAINRAATAARTAASVEVRKDYAIKARDVRAGFRITKRARGREHEAILVTRGRPFPLSAFSANQTRRGPTVVVKKGTGRQRVSRGFYGQGGKLRSDRIYQRTTDARLPIRQAFGPSLPQMIGATGVRSRIVGRAQEIYDSTLEDSLRYNIQRRIERAALGGGRR